jgi:hypothetical protein
MEFIGDLADASRMTARQWRRSAAAVGVGVGWRRRLAASAGGVGTMWQVAHVDICVRRCG